MSNPKSSYLQARADLSNLENQRANVVAKQHDMGRRHALETRHSEAEKAFDDMRVRHVRGIASASDVEAASDAVAAVAAELQQLNDEERVARDAMRELAIEIPRAKAVLSARLAACCMADANNKESTLRDDKKIRRALAEILAAYRASCEPRLGAALGSGVSWEGVLLDIFPLPPDDEFEAIYNSYTERLLDGR